MLRGFYVHFYVECYVETIHHREIEGSKHETKRNRLRKESVSLKLITRNCKIQWSILIFQRSLKNWLDILSGYYSREAVFETQMKIHYFYGSRPQ